MSAAVVLCGGRSSRMGQPKAWLPIGDETLLQYVVRIVLKHCSPVIVVAAAGHELPELPDSVVVIRDDKNFQGPLNGLKNALKMIQSESFFLTACDVPYLTSDFVDLMLKRLQLSKSWAVVPQVGGQIYPLSAAYRIDIHPIVNEMISKDQLRFKDLFQYIPTDFVSPADIGLSFENNAPWHGVNTLSEFESSQKTQ